VWDTKSAAFPKPVDINIDYLRSGRGVTTYASARLARQGRRVVNVHSQLWQEDESKPIAALRGHLLLP
jgi:acyl-coenzyme A thioesterase PaaI-like protein